VARERSFRTAIWVLGVVGRLYYRPTPLTFLNFLACRKFFNTLVLIAPYRHLTSIEKRVVRPRKAGVAC
jgi:hypothetical protein